MTELLALCSAVPAELSGLSALLQNSTSERHGNLTVERGRLGDRPVILTPLGIGDLAGRNARLLLEAFSPGALYLLGFAGGVNPRLAPGTPVLCHPVRSDDLEFRPDAGCLEKAKAGAEAEELSPETGPVRTVPSVLDTPSRKQDLFEKEPDLLAVEMENGHVAGVCRNARIPFCGVRVVFDSADEELPDLSSVLDPYGRVKPLRMAGHLLLNPLRIRNLMKMGRRYRSVRPILDRWVARFAQM